LPATSW